MDWFATSLLFVCLVSCAVTAGMAARKGASALAWATLGLVLGPLGIAWAWWRLRLQPDVEPDDGDPHAR